MGASILIFLHFDEGYRGGCISLNIISGYKFKKKSSSMLHGHGAPIFDPTISKYNNYYNHQVPEILKIHLGKNKKIL